MTRYCKTMQDACTPSITKGAEIASPSPPFSVCVGTNKLTWDGTAMSIEKGTPIPDGVYTSVTILDGCIVDAAHAPIPEYTPPPCVDAPPPCEGGSTDTVVNPSAGNLTKDTPDGIYTKVYIEAGSGATVMGSGVVGDPIVISAATTEDGDVLVSGTADIEIKHPSEGTTSIGLKDSGIGAGTYSGITFNSRGIATNYEAVGGSGIIGVMGAHEVSVDPPVAGLVTVTLNKSDVGGQKLVAGELEILLTQGGTIKSTAPATPLVVAGSFTTSDGKTVTFDEYGRITGVS